jgi:Methyltransferase domain
VGKDEIAELWPGQSRELLKELHILTREGRLNQDSRRKLKQVQHLIQLMTPHLETVESIADLGAGKSYLGFMLYDLYLHQHDNKSLWAIESRLDLIERCRKIAAQSNFSRIHFVQSTIANATQSADLPAQIDAVMALHACDTATDEAIALALQKDAKFIALVPCCQAEVARLLEEVTDVVKRQSHRSLASLWRHGIHRREFGSHLTNVIRALFLEANGYKVRVTELIGWEHSMKNELIIANRIQKGNAQAKAELEALLAIFPLPMRLFDLTGTKY